MAFFAVGNYIGSRLLNGLPNFATRNIGLEMRQNAGGGFSFCAHLDLYKTRALVSYAVAFNSIAATRALSKISHLHRLPFVLPSAAYFDGPESVV